jgi:tetratricopeptide (TPR) repeat protein
MKVLQLLFISALVSLVSCKTRSVSITETIQIPDLLMRPHVIGPEEEMGFVLDTYRKLTDNIKTRPDDIESRLSLTELFMQEARISGEHGHYYPAALGIVEGVLKQELIEPLRYRALLDKASILLSQHQFTEAKEAGLKALAINAYSADAYGVLADAYVELGRYDQAIEMADKMVSIRPDIRSYSRVSYLREIHGQIEGAIEAMKLAVAAGYPGMEQTEWARLTLGNLYEHYGSPDSAMMQYQIALSARPNYPFAIAAISNLHANDGNAHVADSLNAFALQLIPEVSFFINRAKWEKDRGNLSKSEKMTREILEMISDDEKSGHVMSLELANVYLELMGDTELALEQAMKEYRLRPDNIDVNRMLAEIYFHQGNFGKSDEHLAKALRTGSKHPVAKCLEGLLLTKSEMKKEGEKILKQLFVQIPYLDCSLCKEARSIII